MKFPRWLALMLVWAASTALAFPLGAWWGPWAGGILSGVICGIAVLAYQWGPAEFLGWLWLELWSLPSTLACLWWDHCTPTGRRVRRRARNAQYCKLCWDYDCDHPHTGRDDPEDDPGSILRPLTGWDLLLLEKYAEGRATGQPEVHPTTTPTDTTKES